MKIQEQYLNLSRGGAGRDMTGLTVVSTTESQALTNKTLTSPTITTPTLTGPVTPTNEIDFGVTFGIKAIC